MSLSLLITAFLPLSALTVSILQPLQEPRDVGLGMLSWPGQPDNSSAEDVDPESSLIIETVGSYPNTNISFLAPDANVSDSAFNVPFEYPDMDFIESSNADVECDGARFGVDLSRRSCSTLLLDRIRGFDTMYDIGQRFKGTFQVVLPSRISSCECIIITVR